MPYCDETFPIHFLPFTTQLPSTPTMYYSGWQYSLKALVLWGMIPTSAFSDHEALESCGRTQPTPDCTNGSLRFHAV